MQRAFKHVPRAEIFAQTGLQFMPFNTLDPLLAGLNAKAIQEYCRETRQQVPKTDGGLVRCCYESLALKYREVD